MDQHSSQIQGIHTLTGRDLLPSLNLIRSNTPGYLLEVTRRYGDLVHILLGKQHVFIVNHPDSIRRVLQDNHRNYSKDTIQYNALSTVTGRGLLTSDGDTWLVHRRMAQPAFARPRLAQLDQVVVPATARQLAHWQAGSMVDVDSEMMRLALEIVGRALFSIDLAQDASRLVKAVLTALDHIIFRAQNFIYPPDWVPTLRNLRFRRAVQELDAAVYQLIDSRRSSTQPRDDLLGMLLAARSEEGQALSRQQVRDEVITLLIAGHETVASALTWTFYLLAQNPHAWEKIQSEVKTVLGEREPGTSDLPRLAYTGQVFQEALRLYPPAWLITRKAVGADQLDGQAIPAGSLIVMSPYVVHRHPQVWQDAERFQPERFAAENEGDRPRFAFIPFGGGPRLCIGNNFALIEGTLILAMVAQRFCLELPPESTVKVDPLVTLRPHGGLPMIVRAHQA